METRRRIGARQRVAGAGIDPGRLYAYVGTAPDNVERATRPTPK